LEVGGSSISLSGKINELMMVFLNLINDAQAEEEEKEKMEMQKKLKHKIMAVCDATMTLFVCFFCFF
jgi:hypothetical protein